MVTLRMTAAGVLGYILGCMCSGYYLVRGWIGIDVRETGSGGTGATNVGRVLGPAGFVAVLLADMSKAALAVTLAARLGCSQGGRVAAGVGAVAGHLWPAQLGFRGGKGIAPALGALLALDPPLAVVQTLVFGAFRALLGRWVPAAMLACLCGPVLAAGLRRPPILVAGLSGCAGLILIGHRENLSGAEVGEPPVVRMGNEPRGDV